MRLLNAEYQDERLLSFSVKLEESGDTFSVDIYGAPEAHPQRHLAYWNFPAPRERTPLTIDIQLSRLATDSVTVKIGNQMIAPCLVWINPRCEQLTQLAVKLVLWQAGQIAEIAEHRLSLSPSASAHLTEQLNQLRFLEDTQHYQNEFLDPTRLDYPELILLEASGRCNLRCIMCPRTLEAQEEYGDFDPQMLERLRPFIRHAFAICLSLFGEPLMNLRLGELIRNLRKINPAIFVSITTNGMLLTRQRAHELLQLKVNSLTVSLDAVDEELLKQIRPGASLAKIVQNLEQLTELKKQHGSRLPRLQLAFVAMPENLEQLPGLVQLAARLDIPTISIAPEDDFARRVNERFQVPLSEFAPRLRTAYEQAKSVADRSGVSFVYEMPQRLFSLMEGNEREDELAAQERQQFPSHFLKSCEVPWRHCFIGWQGNVYPCCVSSRALGNLHQHTLEQIWRGHSFQNFRQGLKSSEPYPECRDCIRTSWVEKHPAASILPFTIMGKTEMPGRGWGPLEERLPEQHYRVAAGHSALLFLRHRDEKWLRFEGGNFHLLSPLHYTLYFGNQPGGELTLPYGWYACSLPVPSNLPPGVVAISFKSKGGRARLALRQLAFQAQCKKSRPGYLHLLQAPWLPGFLKTLLLTLIHYPRAALSYAKLKKSGHKDS